MSPLSRWLPFLKWPRPDAALLRGEVAAAITVALVMIPQSVAYAGLAGMPLITGLYATFLPMVAAVLFSASTMGRKVAYSPVISGMPASPA